MVNQLNSSTTKYMEEYCVTHMNPSIEPKTSDFIANAYDYEDFTRTLVEN